MTKTGNKRISTAAYQALRDALPVIVWYKRSFNRYMRTALRQHPALLAGIDFDLPKREVADEIVDRLIQDESIYQDVSLRLMMEVANTASFPELKIMRTVTGLLQRHAQQSHY